MSSNSLIQKQKRQPEVLAFIPARGGSRGIPKKNIQLLGGVPLIAYSINDARLAISVTRVIVSTDSQEIAEVAREAGAEVPFLRPEELAGDKSLIGDALDYTCKRLSMEEGFRPDAIIYLYPTSPFRPAGLIDTLVAHALRERSSAVTYKHIRSNPQRYFHNLDGRAMPMMEQNAPVRSAFRAYGLCTVQIPGLSSSPYIHVVDDPASFVDIDTWEDLALAELVIIHGLYTPRFGLREGGINA